MSKKNSSNNTTFPGLEVGGLYKYVYRDTVEFSFIVTSIDYKGGWAWGIKLTDNEEIVLNQDAIDYCQYVSSPGIEMAATLFSSDE
jgi:hypothetical protein